MITQISPDDPGIVDLVPQAVIAIPTTYFTRVFGCQFHKEADDLDNYEAAFFRLDDDLPFALIHYRGEPTDRTTLYFREDNRDSSNVIRRILSEFVIADAAPEWVRPAEDRGEGDPALPRHGPDLAKS
jgi:hypothetical protein